MQDRRRVEPKLEVLSEPAAARLLARASELDATLAAGATLTDLRTAAAEAGISSGAFDAALAEMRAAEHAPAPDVTPRPRPRSCFAVSQADRPPPSYVRSSSCPRTVS